MIVPDANLLIYATHTASPFHAQAHEWWSDALAGHEFIGLGWASLLTYLRISTNPAVYSRPLTMDTAVADIETWLSASYVHVIHPGERHPHALRALTPLGSDANFVNNVHLAALAWEHGGTVYSADQDFHRIPQVKWINPLQ